MALSLGAETVELDSSVPFSMARGRNAGYKHLLHNHPGVEYIQFIDGDCVVADDWVDLAVPYLASHPEVAIVCGRRMERFPRASIYNLLIDIEWNGPIGQIESCGGDAMIRADTLECVGGYDEQLIAGEEGELCARLRERGWRICRLDAGMTTHDAAMTRFAQWWKRSVRSGYGALDVARRPRGQHTAFPRQVRSTRLWALGWPVAVCCAGGVMTLLGGVEARALAALVVAMFLPLQIARVTGHLLQRRVALRHSLLYACFTMLAKWPQLVGHIRWTQDRRANRAPVLMEYKSIKS